MKRLQIAAGNWKMNKTYDEAIDLATVLSTGERGTDTLMILGVPSPYLKSVSDIVAKHDGLEVAAQNCSNHNSGAYTGETSVRMIKSVGAKYVILGHSERREYFNESDALIAEKLDKVYDAGLTPIFCCGEPLEIRKAGTHVEHVKSQLKNSLSHLTAAQLDTLIIAYEPIWAIGTGETASPQQAQDMHKALREYLLEMFNPDIAAKIPILYGGSVKPANAVELFSCPDVDGGLVGGASLDGEGFLQISKSF